MKKFVKKLIFLSEGLFDGAPQERHAIQEIPLLNRHLFQNKN